MRFEVWKMTVKVYSDERFFLPRYRILRDFTGGEDEVSMSLMGGWC